MLLGKTLWAGSQPQGLCQLSSQGHQGVQSQGEVLAPSTNIGPGRSRPTSPERSKPSSSGPWEKPTIGRFCKNICSNHDALEQWFPFPSTPGVAFWTFPDGFSQEFLKNQWSPKFLDHSSPFAKILDALNIRVSKNL